MSILSASGPLNLPENSVNNDIVCKVLVYEHDKSVSALLKEFFTHSNLVGYAVRKDNLVRILNSNVDLGGVFITENDSRGHSNLGLAIDVHKNRPELPIFLRRESLHHMEDYPKELQKIFAGFYLKTDLSPLKELTDTFLFTRHYPNEFVHEIRSKSLEAIKSSFKNMLITVEPPYIVKDKVIYGELFSLMPLESSWCRGYMMLQSEETNVLDVIKARKTTLNPIEPNFRHVNSVFGELSNMIWGAFKNLYGSAGIGNGLRVEVPIIVNHARKYISFGSEDPQLCLKYTLSDQDGTLQPIVIYQKFIFSLAWSPEKFAESQKKVEALVSTGELELF
ncbi:MAG: chemotaxis protein CheX [Gammaproteobacteria bacterium]|nr:chemotaxis protein CheX [Gammaproteobacteria bacterium]